MFSLTESIINTCVERLQAGYRHTYGNLKPEYADLIGWFASMALENIANSNALYHNIEHTILATFTGQEILRGKHIRYGSVSCEDWLHVIISLLFHDIGYVKGVCLQDRPKERFYDKGINGEMIFLPAGSTDASLTPYHIDRGKTFFEDRFSEHYLIDIELIKQNIEMTRFPVPNDEYHQDTVNYPGLVRAADLIGQLSDPHYLEKMPALFYEFEETGANKSLGYRHFGELRAGYPKFFWKVVYPLIQAALHHLEVTKEGQQIVGNLYKNVLIVEQEIEEENQIVKNEEFENERSYVSVAAEQLMCDRVGCQENKNLRVDIINKQIFEFNSQLLNFLERKKRRCYFSNY
ncbi:Npun_R2479 family HD domain-containing metalloprotein [Aerosakkonema sp. BLCC-F183]|uniref:Npun_R2479 family HD domain-containing metalloprotein n=1 Tax=Aerosakkonema sp. BLCC-F183 TaxID=3342834 RepID=UPI0035BA6383